MRPPDAIPDAEMITAGWLKALSAFDSSVVWWTVKLRKPNGVPEESCGIGLCASGNF